MSYQDNEEVKIGDFSEEEEDAGLDDALLDDPLVEDELVIEDEILEEDDMPEEFAGLDGSNTDY